LILGTELLIIKETKKAERKRGASFFMCRVGEQKRRGREGGEAEIAGIC